jgi:hypothetical protein
MEQRNVNPVIVLVLLVWLVVTPVVWRDLGRRSAAQVRGPKWLWRAASSNLTGSVAYLLIGRKHSD